MSTVIKAGQAARILRRLSTVDLADHLAEATAVVDAAKEDAARMTTRARTDATEALARARREGVETGYEAGHREGKDAGFKAAHEEAADQFTRQHASLVSLMNEATTALTDMKQELRIEAERHLLELAVQIATKLTFRIGKLDREAAGSNVRRAIELVDSKTDVVVHVHPSDVASLGDFADDVLRGAERSRNVRIVEDSDMHPGGCRVVSEKTEVDSTLETQVARMVTALLGEEKTDG